MEGYYKRVEFPQKAKQIELTGDTGFARYLTDGNFFTDEVDGLGFIVVEDGPLQ